MGTDIFGFQLLGAEIMGFKVALNIGTFFWDTLYLLQVVLTALCPVFRDGPFPAAEHRESLGN